MPDRAGPPKPDSRASNSHAKLAALAVGAGLIGALVLGEIAVRLLLPVHTPETVRAHSMPYVQAPYAGYLIEPVDRLVELDSDKAWGRKPADAPSEHSVYIGPHGYRGPGVEVRKPDGIFRIVVLGASAVFDRNASDTADERQRSWPHRVGKRLEAAGLDGIEIVNAGIPGQNSADSLGRLFTQLWTYEPDMVVVYHGWNDIKFWHRLAVSPETPLIRQVRTYDPTDNPFMFYRGPVDRALGVSQLYMRVRNLYFRWRYEPGAEGALPADAPLADDFGPWGPRQFELNLALIVEAATRTGATPILVTQATLADADNAAADQARIGYRYQGLTHDAIVRAFERTYRIVKDLGAATQTPVVDAAALLNGRSELFEDHVHTTETGSDALARVVADALLPLIVSARASASKAPAEDR